MSQWFKKHWGFWLLVLFLVAWTLFFVFIPPSIFIDNIGVHNTYLIAFLLAVFGGLSTLTGAPFFVSIATFGAGGANPLLLGIFGGLGIFLSDSIFFLIARRGVRVLEARSIPNIQKFSEKIAKLPPWIMYTFVLCYIGFTPFPNDLLMLALALAGIRYLHLAPVLMVGSFSIVTLTASLGHTLF